MVVSADAKSLNAEADVGGQILIVSLLDSNEICTLGDEVALAEKLAVQVPVEVVKIKLGIVHKYEFSKEVAESVVHLRACRHIVLVKAMLKYRIAGNHDLPSVLVISPFPGSPIVEHHIEVDVIGIFCLADYSEATTVVAESEVVGVGYFVDHIVIVADNAPYVVYRGFIEIYALVFDEVEEGVFVRNVTCAAVIPDVNGHKSADRAGCILIFVRAYLTAIHAYAVSPSVIASCGSFLVAAHVAHALVHIEVSTYALALVTYAVGPIAVTAGIVAYGAVTFGNVAVITFHTAL